jgi:hypothetical protein
MDYQNHILDLIEKEVVNHKLVPVTDMESDTKGRIIVMRKFEVCGAMFFEFGADIVHFTVGGDRLFITGGRNNRIFNWGFSDWDDTNEEVERFFKVLHLILKEASKGQDKEGALAA